MNEILLLASLLTAECNTCSEFEKQLICSVVLNRANRQEKCITDIIYQKNQFKGISHKNFYPTTDHIIIASRAILSGPVDSSIIYFYLKKSPWKKWRDNIKPVKMHKKTMHEFCKNRLN